MIETKVCTTCGQEKSPEEFRRYPGNSPRRYPYCLECQSIETRRRYLVGKVKSRTNTVEEGVELEQIEDLYRLRLEKGLKTLGARSGKSSTVRHLVDQQRLRLENIVP